MGRAGEGGAGGGRGGAAVRRCMVQGRRFDRAVELRAMPPAGAEGARSNPLFAQGLPQSFGGSGAAAMGAPPGAWRMAAAGGGGGVGDGNFPPRGGLGPAGLPGIEQPMSPFRRRLNRAVYSIPVQVLVVFLVLGDLTCLILEYTHPDAGEDFVYRVDLACTVILALLSAEFLLRLAATQFAVFVRDGWNYLDFVVLFVSVVLVAIDTVDSKRASKIATTGRLVRAIRSTVRGLQVLRVGMKAQQGIKKGATAARMQVSMNKKRFLQQGFNLDLSFITPRLIAMSVPAVGHAQLYRNPLPEVARFFESFYGPQASPDGLGKAHYRIYNVCPEHPYPTELFSGKVVPYQVQDHTPPSLDTLVAMCLDAEIFLAGSSANVIAVHCRGGKGRTGSLCVAWLLYSRAVETIEEGLEKFATQRTDLNMKGKLQGVETPSQVRFLQYLDQMLQTRGCYLGGSEPLRAPATRALRLEGVRGERFFAQSGWKKKEPPSHLFCTVSSDGHVYGAAEAVTVDKEGSFAFTFGDSESEDPPVLSREVRVNVFDAAVTASLADLKVTAKAGKEPGLLFFFWVHTAFLEEENVLDLEVVDKACKNKQKWFRPEGRIILRSSAGDNA